MSWYARPLVVLRSLLHPLDRKTSPGAVDPNRARPPDKPSITLQRRDFYAHLTTRECERCQVHMDRIFKLSPTLEFEEGDPRLKRLLEVAAEEDRLSQLDLELMRLQYVLADRDRRRTHRACWVDRVVNRKKGDFFPDPWTIIASVFRS